MSCAESPLSSFSTPTVDDVRGGLAAAQRSPHADLGTTHRPGAAPVSSLMQASGAPGGPRLSLPVSRVFPPVTLRGWAGSPEPGGWSSARAPASTASLSLKLQLPSLYERTQGPAQPGSGDAISAPDPGESTSSWQLPRTVELVREGLMNVPVSRAGLTRLLLV